MSAVASLSPARPPPNLTRLPECPTISLGLVEQLDPPGRLPTIRPTDDGFGSTAGATRRPGERQITDRISDPQLPRRDQSGRNASFDDLVGAGEDRLWHCQTECLRGLEV